MTSSSNDNPIARLFATNPPKTLADLLTERQVLPTTNNTPGIFGSLAPRPAAISNPFATPGLFGSPRPATLPVAPRPDGLAAALWPYLDPIGLGKAAPPLKPALPVAPAITKRKGFFSFHYDDIMRVNNVRNAWKLAHPDREIKRNFYDRSLWESTKRTNPEGLKKLIRDGMSHASTVCVMVGTGTWARPWVRYEIARAVVDKKGLLAIHINGIRRHDGHRQADPLGMNPLNFVGVYNAPTGGFYVYEKNFVRLNPFTGEGQWQWQPFGLYTASVPLPKYMAAPQPGYIQPLSGCTAIHDYAADRGSINLGAWIDVAAKRVGR